MATRRMFLTRATAGALAAVVASKGADAKDLTAAAGPLTPKKICKIPQTDLTVSRIAFGAGGLGANASELINTVYDCGITFFDVADIYDEAPLGDVLRKSPGLRGKIVLQSKCCLVVRQEDQLFYVDSSAEHIVTSAEGSLRRLATDHLDILLLHWPDALVEPEEVASAFDQLHRSGKVRHFGVSNHTPTQIDLLKRYVRQPLVANQIYLSLENSYLVAGGIVTLWSQDANPYNYVGASGTLDYCRLHGIQVQAWSPLRGELVNSTNSASPSIKQAAQILESIAKKKNTTPSAVALAWLLRYPGGIVPIIYSNNPDHVVEDSAAMDISLSREEWYRLLTATYGIRSRKPI